MAPVHGRKIDNKFNEIAVKRLHAFGKNTRKYAQKKVVRLDSRAHVPLVTRVSHSNYYATCQIKSIARYVGYFKYSQISRVVCGGEGGGVTNTDTPHSDISDIFCLSTIKKD